MLRVGRPWPLALQLSFPVISITRWTKTKPTNIPVCVTWFTGAYASSITEMAIFAQTVTPKRVSA